MTQPPNAPENVEPLPPLSAPYPRPWRALLIGGGAGVLLSSFMWIAMLHHVDKMPWILGAVPLVKIGAGIVLVASSRRTRFAGIGLLLSIPLGALIFMGACFGQILKG